jgi:putative transposase
MVLQDYRHREIQALLQVSSGFISKWTQAFEQHGVEGLRLQHKGSTGYLDAQERLAVLEWLKQKNYWDLQELQVYLENNARCGVSLRTSLLRVISYCRH